MGLLQRRSHKNENGQASWKLQFNFDRSQHEHGDLWRKSWPKETNGGVFPRKWWPYWWVGMHSNDPICQPLAPVPQLYLFVLRTPLFHMCVPFITEWHFNHRIFDLVPFDISLGQPACPQLPVACCGYTLPPGEFDVCLLFPSKNQ